MSAAVVEYPHDRRMSMQMMQASFESLLDPSLLSLDSFAATFDNHARRSSAVSLRFTQDDTLDVDAMFDSMFAGPNNEGSVSSGSEFESEKAELESLLSESYATSEHTEVPDGARSVQSTPMFAPIGSFPSMAIPSNTAHSILIPTDLPTTKQPLSFPKTTSPTSLVPSYAAGSRKKPSTKRPRSQSNPQYVAPTLVASTTNSTGSARQPIARNASTASVPEHLLSSAPITVIIPQIKEEPASPIPAANDYLDMLTRSTLGPDPALLEDAKLDEIEDAMIDEGCEEEGEKKGKKRRRRTTAELSTSELETRRLKNSEAARRCRLRKALRVKWLEARVKELEEMNGLLVGKLRERN